jgi:hypothetical protein
MVIKGCVLLCGLVCVQVDVIELQKQYAELQEAHYQQVRRSTQLISLGKRFYHLVSL